MLTKISAHLTDHHNPKVYLKQYTKNRLKYNSLGILLNNITNKIPNIKLYLNDIDYFIDTLFNFVEYDRK